MRGRIEMVPDLVEAIRVIDPDVLALQEVATWEQAKRLAALLDLNFAHTLHDPGPEGSWWGLATLSKYPIAETRTVSLSRVGPPYSARSVQISRVHIGGRSISVVNVHRDNREGGDSSVRALLRVTENVPAPRVLLGDLNLTPTDPRMKPLLRRFADPLDVLYTANALKAKRQGTHVYMRIDYVLFDPPHFDPIDAGLTPGHLHAASDHAGFYARLRWNQ